MTSALTKDQAEEYQAGPKPSGPGALLAFIDFTAWSASASEKGETKALRSGVGALEYRAVGMKTVELGRKTPQPFSTFTFEIRKRKRISRTRKRTRTYGISRISETNQFERNYVEHGRYAKIQYEIPTHSA